MDSLIHQNLQYTNILRVLSISILKPGIRICPENLQKDRANGRFSERTMVDKNGESTLETLNPEALNLGQRTYQFLQARQNPNVSGPEFRLDIPTKRALGEL